MKRIVSLILVSLLTLSVFFCLAGCGKVNKSEVSILWSGEGEAINPNSLINSMERAMYMKKVDYKHYGANGDAALQLEQAKTALDAGCQVLVVEPVFTSSNEHPQEIVDAAKAKNVPVVFFNCNVSDEVINSYDKCFCVKSNLPTVVDVQAELIANYIKKNFNDVDKNKDNKVSILAYNINSTHADSIIAKANELLAAKDYRVTHSKIPFVGKLNTSVELVSADLTSAEIILTASDTDALAVFTELQKSDYNTDKLKTQFVPILTVGNTVDYKALVVNERPSIPDELVIRENDDKKTINSKNKEIKKLKDLMSYYESKKFIVDLTAVNESDIDAMIYTTINVVDAGRIAGTVLEDNDSIALAVAGVVSNICKGKDTFDKIPSKVKDDETPGVVVDGKTVLIRYTTYGE